MRVFETRAHGPIYLQEDDVQVLSRIMAGATMMEEAVLEAGKRGIFAGFSKIGDFDADTILRLMKSREYDKLAAYTMGKWLAIWPEAKTL